MLLNGYDSTVGRLSKSTDNVESTLAALHVSRSLTPTKKDNVFVITHETDLGVNVFAFPMTFQAYNRQTITVYDERPYRNKGNNQVTSPNEITIMRLAAFLQQDVAEGNLTPLKNGRIQVTKAFTEAVRSKMASKAHLLPDEVMTLNMLLAFFFICLEEENNTDLQFVATNVIRTIYGAEKGYILGVIEELPQLRTLEELLDAIHANPRLYKLKTVTLKDFTALISTIMFMSIGPRVVGAACELPCLMTAMVYGCTRFRAYQKTPLGTALDPKYNKNTLESFVKNIDYTYNLNG